MEGVKRALTVTILSRGWAAALALLAVPFYLRFIGVEAFGVVGLFVSFSILVSFLDLGLGATLTRELARQSVKADSLAEGRDIVRTFELTYALIAMLIGLLVIACAALVAEHWVQARALSSDEIAHALALAGVALAIQWPSNLYTAGLAGVHRQVQLGAATMLFATIRVLLTVGAVWWKPSIESFFWAQICSALIHTLGMRWLLWNALTLRRHQPRFRFSIIQSSFRFAGGMTGIAITSIILTQTDKVILSNALSLNDFGVYVVAGTLAAGLYIFISPMFSVMYPRFSSLIHEGNNAKLVDFYHTSSQAMAALVFPVAMLIAFFSQEVLYIWTGNAVLAQQGAWILAFLIIGNACNGIMNIPYALQLASGWTKLAFWINVGAIVLLVPAIWWAATYFGAAGAAAVWAILNLGYVLLTPHIMHRRLLPKEKASWYIKSFLVPLLVCVMFMIVIASYPLSELSRFSAAVLLIIYWALITASTIIALPRLRNLAAYWLQARLTQHQS